MAAPTEAEIREAVANADTQRLPDPWDFASVYTGAVAYIPEDELGEGVSNRVWANLRPSEADRLTYLLDAVYDVATERVAALEAEIREAVVAACMTFAAEFPEAPRAKQLVSAAS